MDGYHSCIFAYGQTGSGKTHTMEGNELDPGINVRAFEMLFAEVAKREAHYHYEVHATMVEIYNEKLRDLLREPADGPIGDSGRFVHVLCDWLRGCDVWYWKECLCAEPWTFESSKQNQ